jgi:hypothetical protein
MKTAQLLTQGLVRRKIASGPVAAGRRAQVPKKTPWPSSYDHKSRHLGQVVKETPKLGFPPANAAAAASLQRDPEYLKALNQHPGKNYETDSPGLLARALTDKTPSASFPVDPAPRQRDGRPYFPSPNHRSMLEYGEPRSRPGEWKGLETLWARPEMQRLKGLINSARGQSDLSSLRANPPTDYYPTSGRHRRRKSSGVGMKTALWTEIATGVASGLGAAGGGIVGGLVGGGRRAFGEAENLHAEAQRYERGATAKLDEAMDKGRGLNIPGHQDSMAEFWDGQREFEEKLPGMVAESAKKVRRSTAVGAGVGALAGAGVAGGATYLLGRAIRKRREENERKRLAMGLP